MKTILIILGILAIIFYAFLLLWCKRNARETYESDFIYLESFLIKAAICESNFDFIIQEFEKLTTNNQYPERTLALWERFEEIYMGYGSELKEFEEMQAKINRI